MKRNVALYIVCFMIVPLLLSFVVPFVSTELDRAGILLLLISYAGCGGAAAYLFAKRERAVLTSKQRFLPVIIPSFLVVLAASVLMLVTKGSFGHESWGIFVLLLFPFLPNSFISALSGQLLSVFFAPFAYYTAFLIVYMLKWRKARVGKKAFLSGMAAWLVCLSVIGAVYWQRSQTILPAYGFQYENGYSSVDLAPYYVTEPTNKLAKLKEPASFQIMKQDDMPVLDGAEAAYPVYAAFANAVYVDIKDKNITQNRGEIVSFMNTIYAFERLVSGEVDIFFGAQPSEEQKQLARSNGKELVLTPIGKEAFVFFVNSENPVSNLSIEQVKGIYSGKIKNWSAAGGESIKITAFQRPEGSGSQTVMKHVMGDAKLMNPMKEEIPGMGEIMEEVAAYRNYQSAIGYSFRFFTSGMNPSKDIKLLSINGIEPTTESISSGTYPFVVNLYAITVKDNPNKNIVPFLEWMQGPQGQKLVEDTGYVPL